ncbi:MAG: CapA family protein [Spirochaetaceae bacterium]|nr:CapA family protein [Spirochaetaceae bacterium]
MLKVQNHFILHLLTLLSLLFCFASTLPAESTTQSITLGFAGDIMIHNSQLRRAWQGENKSGNDLGYNFNPAFEWFTPYLKKPDLMVGNLETTFGGPDSAWMTDEEYAFREYQAYPTFTTPDELASALKNAGFDLLSTANNHCMDSNLEGASRTLEVLERAGLESTGTSGIGSPEPWRGDVEGFKISILAWTASVNGLISSRGMETINVFSSRGHDGRLQKMLTEIRAEAALNRDLVILSIHWGQEYFEEPDQYQKNLANLAIEAGVDIIIGSHPHVLQPVERRIITTPDGPEEVFIAWSMGNFISSQRHQKGEREWVDGSVILNLEINRDSTGKARVSAASFIPLYVHWTQEDIRILSVTDGLDQGAADLYELSEYDLERLQALDNWIPGQITRYLGSTPTRKVGSGWQVEF